MAIQTKVLGTAYEPEGFARLEVDYDDNQLRLRVARIVNTHPTLTARATATAVSDPTRSYTLNGLPNQTTSVNIPTGPANRLDITIDARGRLDGVEYQFGWQ